MLDSGARGSTTTFVERGVGDVLIAWENEAYLLGAKISVPDKFEIVTPSISILAEPTVARGRQRRRQEGHARGRRSLPELSLQPEGQEIAAQELLSAARSEAVAEKYASQFPQVKLFTIDEVFGGWRKAQKTHFADGGTFDQIYQPASKS